MGSVFGLDKNNSDYIFRHLASFTPHKIDPRFLNSIIQKSILQTISKDEDDGMKPKVLNKI